MSSLRVVFVLLSILIHVLSETIKRLLQLLYLRGAEILTSSLTSCDRPWIALFPMNCRNLCRPGAWAKQDEARTRLIAAVCSNCHAEPTLLKWLPVGPLRHCDVTVTSQYVPSGIIRCSLE